MSSSSFSQPAGTQVVAFFHDREEAYEAVDDLRTAGFTQNEIGLAFQDSSDRSAVSDSSENIGDESHDGKSMWQKVKDFFTGPDDYSPDGGTGYSNADFDGHQHFNFAEDQWKYYRAGISKGGAIVSVTADATRLDRARQILEDRNGDIRTSGFDLTAFGTSEAESEQRLQLRGEMLRTYKERVSKGEVRVRKEVVTENQTINVPVSREEVVIEQVSADQASPLSGNMTGIGEGEEIRVPVTEERVRVEKQPNVTGEVRVGKRTVQDTQTVSDTVRREEARVENEGDISVSDSVSKRKQKKPAA